MNLCTNAFQSIPEGEEGVVSVSVETVRLGADFVRECPSFQRGEYALITVRDTGCGMDAETGARAFDPFFTTKAIGEGTGLGLSVSQGIVARHDGYITVEGQPGGGTTVRVYLPSRHQEPDPSQPNLLRSPRGRSSVLVVDDDERVATLSKRILEHFGYSVSAVGSATEALERFRYHPESFDVVVADQKMPGTTGIELARELKRIRVDLAVVLVSGMGSSLNGERVAGGAVQVYLSKPFTADELGWAVIHALEKGPSDPGELSPGGEKWREYS